jgi:polyphosphate glucokinase
MSAISDDPHRDIKSAPDSRILAIDIGGTGLKAAILDFDGNMLTERVRMATPHPLTKELLIESLQSLVEPLTGYDFVSVGFPGVVRRGRIITAPNLGTEELRGLEITAALEQRLGKPVRVVNDADMQGLGAIEGKGIEMVITLGTGFGTSVFKDGEIAPHLEIAHMPFRKNETFDKQLGDKARKKVGRKAWSRRVKRAIDHIRTLTNFDVLYVGGGNAKSIDFKLPDDVKVVSNDFGVRGGAWLWRERHPDQGE